MKISGSGAAVGALVCGAARSAVMLAFNGDSIGGYPSFVIGVLVGAIAGGLGRPVAGAIVGGLLSTVTAVAFMVPLSLIEVLQKEFKPQHPHLNVTSTIWICVACMGLAGALGGGGGGLVGQARDRHARRQADPPPPAAEA